MRTRDLGASGPAVGAIAFGGMYLSIARRPDSQAAAETIRAAIDAGVTLIDTANVYCHDDTEIGHNERVVRDALRGVGAKVIVATKGGLRRPGGRWAHDGRPDRLVAQCEESLRALGVDRIDLYQLHAPDPAVPLEDSVGALARLRETGKIALVGLSNVSVEEVKRARRIVPIASVQNEWNPFHRTPERDGMLEYCEHEEIAFLAYSPFGGAYRSRALQRGSFGRTAKRRNVSPHRLSLAWMLARSRVAIPIVGARRAASIRDSADAAELSLSPSDRANIEAALPPTWASYPILAVEYLRARMGAVLAGPYQRT